MKVLVVNNMAPFIWGGAEELAVNLQKNLIAVGHQSEVLRIPFQWEPASGIPAQMLLTRALELYNCDQVIALKFPAYLIRHPRKTLWLLHQYRQAYDLFDAGQTNIANDNEGAVLRAGIKQADNESFAECRHIYTNSVVTQQRLKHYNQFDSEVLLPPVNDPERFPGLEHKGYIFAGGRINDAKRQHLLLSALALTDSSVRLVIAGPADSQADKDKLCQLVEHLGLADRVKLDIRFLPRETYADYVNHANAVAYLPFDEDSLGYVAMEAATAGKALITTSDSGGILGLVKPNQTGWVAQPDAGSLAQALNAVMQNASRSKQFGQAARALWNSMDVRWDTTIEKLLK